jgi:hypothetical protein
MYSARMGSPSKKARLNLTMDHDLYREAKRVFPVLGLNMSAFVEMNLAQFLQLTRPLLPLLDAVEAGEVDPAALKVAMRGFMSNSQVVLGEQLQTFGEVSGEMAEFLRELEVNTDKK